MDAPFRRGAANRLQGALSGTGEYGPAAAGLARLAGELREVGRAAPALQPSLAAREQLRAAVLAAAAERQGPARRGRFRGATLAIAAVAGTGLVVASAASGSNPAVLVAEIARDLPGIPNHAQPPSTVSLEGEVIATHDGGRTLEIRTRDVTVTVESPRETRAITMEGTPLATSAIAEGDTIRVTTAREPGSGIVPAKKIELLPSTGSTKPVGTSEPTGASNQPTPETRPASLATVPAKQTPTPAPTRTATPTPTPKSNATSVNVAPFQPSALPGGTLKPASTPTRTPTKSAPPYGTNSGSIVAAETASPAPGTN